MKTGSSLKYILDKIISDIAFMAVDDEFFHLYSKALDYGFEYSDILKAAAKQRDRYENIMLKSTYAGTSNEEWYHNRFLDRYENKAF